jgi:hypothetical protein
MADKSNRTKSMNSNLTEIHALVCIFVHKFFISLHTYTFELLKKTYTERRIVSDFLSMHNEREMHNYCILI